LRSGIFWDITQRVLVITSRRFGANYLSHLQMSRNPRHKKELVQGISIECRTKLQCKDRQDFGTRAVLNVHRYGSF